MGLEYNWEDVRAGNWLARERDWVCIPLAKMLQKEGKLSINSIVKKSGLSRQTAFNHLKHLVNDGLLIRETKKSKRGRPKILYSRTKKPISILKEEDAVSLTFKKLSQVCRHQKGRRCKWTLEKCYSSFCPLILK